MNAGEIRTFLQDHYPVVYEHFLGIFYLDSAKTALKNMIHGNFVVINTATKG
jgi:hypothetical protein